MKLSVIILHYGLESDTRLCITSILRYGQLCRIIVVDNDPSQFLSYGVDDFPGSLVEVIKSGGGMGFGQANNFGFVQGKVSTPYVLFLNNDTEVLDNALGKMVDFMDSNPLCSISGPCMPFYSSPDVIWACGGEYNNLRCGISGITEVVSQSPFSVDYIPGAALLIRSELFTLIGMFDERFFLAYEEAVLCESAKKIGGEIIAIPGAVILHKVGMSSQVNRLDYTYNEFRNKFMWAYQIKYLKPVWLHVLLLVLLAYIRGKLPFFLFIKIINDDYRKTKIDRTLLNSIRAVY